jgi:hypothetical protein
MTTIAIFRQAKKAQISTNSHLFNKQEIRNQSQKNNPNLNNMNKVIYYKKGELCEWDFLRNGKNEGLMSVFKSKEQQLDELARADYKAHKIAQKQANPNKKIRTVLQTKNLKREFGIFLGGDKNIVNKEDFEAKIVKSTLAILQKKGLDERNLISIVVHYDEKTPHAHIQYNDYSFEHHTTGQELSKIRQKDGLNKQQLLKLNRSNFGDFQDILAENMEMKRGQKNSKQLNISKTQHYSNLSKILAENKELKTNLINAVDFIKNNIENKEFLQPTINFRR